MAHTTKRARKAKRKGCSCKRIPRYKACDYSTINKVGNLQVKNSSNHKYFFNFFMSLFLWLSFATVIALFLMIIIFSNDDFHPIAYVFNTSNPAFSSIVFIIMYIAIYLTVFIFEKYLDDEIYTYILKSQTGQLSFIIPICFALLFLAFDRMLN